jgi:hypothetical protein
MNLFKLHEVGTALLSDAPPHISSASPYYVNLGKLCVALIPCAFCAETVFVWNELDFEPWPVPPLFKEPPQQAREQTED